MHSLHRYYAHIYDESVHYYQMQRQLDLSRSNADSLILLVLRIERLTSHLPHAAEPSLPSLPCTGRHRIPRFVSSSPQNAPTSRAGAHSFFVRRPRTLIKNSGRCGSDRILYSRCGPRKVREQFNNSRCAPRYAGCRARCPKADINRFPERCMRAARATAYGCDP